MIQSGELRHKGSIFQVDVEGDQYGKPIAPKQLFNVKCNVQIISGTELLKSGVGVSSEFISVKLRFDKRITAKHLFVWDGGQYNIDLI